MIRIAKKRAALKKRQVPGPSPVSSKNRAAPEDSKLRAVTPEDFYDRLTDAFPGFQMDRAGFVELCLGGRRVVRVTEKSEERALSILVEPVDAPLFGLKFLKYIIVYFL